MEIRVPVGLIFASLGVVYKLLLIPDEFWAKDLDVGLGLVSPLLVLESRHRVAYLYVARLL